MAEEKELAEARVRLAPDRTAALSGETVRLVLASEAGPVEPKARLRLAGEAR